MASSDSTKDNLTSSVDPSKEEELIKDFFPYDSDVTDLTLVVEDRKLHVAKVVLIDASPVFRKNVNRGIQREDNVRTGAPWKRIFHICPVSEMYFPKRRI